MVGRNGSGAAPVGVPLRRSAAGRSCSVVSDPWRSRLLGLGACCLSARSLAPSRVRAGGSCRGRKARSGLRFRHLHQGDRARVVSC